MYLTAHSNEKTLHRAKKTEPHGYIIKPISQEELLSTVDIALYKHKMECRLKVSEEQFRASFEDAGIGMAIGNLKGELIRVNQTMCDMTGYSNTELLNMTFMDITHPDDLDIELKYVDQLLEGKINKYKMEKRYPHKKGNIIWVDLNISVIRNNYGETSILYRTNTGHQRTQKVSRNAEGE